VLRSVTPSEDRVLVVDDSGLVREFLRELLSRACRVTTASNGPEAIEAAALDPPMVAVLDYEMPGMTGDRLARRLKAISPATVLILHSAHWFAPDNPARAGFDFYVPKPVTRIADLERTVRLALSIHKARAETVAA
jgi:CheY-like chemotaxis protein